jgi:hypothetical protein
MSYLFNIIVGSFLKIKSLAIFFISPLANSLFQYGKNMTKLLIQQFNRRNLKKASCLVQRVGITVLSTSGVLLVSTGKLLNKGATFLKSRNCKFNTKEFFEKTSSFNADGITASE